MSDPDIPTEALEAAARKLFEHDRMPDDPPWDDVYEADRDSYRNDGDRPVVE